MPTSPTLSQQVCFALYSASRATTALYRTVLKELDLTYPQYLAMLVLWDGDGLEVRELGRELQLDSGTLSPLLKRLEHLGLVERRRLPEDERRVLVRLTPAGRDLQAKAADVPGLIAAATGLVQEELLALRETLHRISTTLQTTESETTP